MKVTLNNPDEWQEQYGIQQHPGYRGVFTTNQANGAIPNGTRIVKVAREPGDITPLDTKGLVHGSIYSEKAGYAYFVEWDHLPRTVILVVGKKIERDDVDGG